MRKLRTGETNGRSCVYVFTWNRSAVRLARGNSSSSTAYLSGSLNRLRNEQLQCRSLTHTTITGRPSAAATAAADANARSRLPSPFFTLTITHLHESNCRDVGEWALGVLVEQVNARGRGSYLGSVRGEALLAAPLEKLERLERRGWGADPVSDSRVCDAGTGTDAHYPCLLRQYLARGGMCSWGLCSCAQPSAPRSHRQSRSATRRMNQPSGRQPATR